MLNSRSIFPIFTMIFTSFLFSCALLADPPENKGKHKKNKGKESTSGYEISFDADLSVIVTAGISIGDARKLATRYELTGSKPIPPGKMTHRREREKLANENTFYDVRQFVCVSRSPPR